MSKFRITFRPHEDDDSTLNFSADSVLEIAHILLLHIEDLAGDDDTSACYMLQDIAPAIANICERYTAGDDSPLTYVHNDCLGFEGFTLTVEFDNDHD
jgi:hypothetical protein